MRRLFIVTFALAISCCGTALAQDHDHPAHADHPDTSGEGWEALVAEDLSNVDVKEGVWSVKDSVLTASEDSCLWSKAEYEKCIIDLEFMNEDGTNSGVIFYCSDTDNWIPNSVEVQIADDFNEKWGKADKTWQCGAIFGHLAAKASLVKKPGAWNRMTITCDGQNITVIQNGHVITEMDMALWTSGKENPDGSEIPSWLSTPFAELATKGKIGLQGKHGDASIHFRNLRIKRLP